MSRMQIRSGGPSSITVLNGGLFTPSSVGSSSFTMDNTNTHSETIGTGVKKLQVVNTGATTQAIYIGFGVDEAAAKVALTWATTIATNGHYIPSPVDAPQTNPVINVPAPYIGGAYAVGNAVAGDTQDVIVSQGV